jgi:hypothetical protein
MQSQVLSPEIDGGRALEERLHLRMQTSMVVTGSLAKRALASFDSWNLAEVEKQDRSRHQSTDRFHLPSITHPHTLASSVGSRIEEPKC